MAGMVAGNGHRVWSGCDYRFGRARYIAGRRMTKVDPATARLKAVTHELNLCGHIYIEWFNYVDYKLR